MTNKWRVNSQVDAHITKSGGTRLTVAGNYRCYRLLSGVRELSGAVIHEKLVISVGIDCVPFIVLLAQ